MADMWTFSCDGLVYIVSVLSAFCFLSKIALKRKEIFVPKMFPWDFKSQESLGFYFLSAIGCHCGMSERKF